MTNERSLESFMPWTPIDHRARHRSAFAAILAVDQEPEARIVEERDRRSGSEYPLLPVASVGGDRYQGEHLDAMLQMRFGAFSKPVSNRRASFPVSAVRRIHEDGRIIPRCGQSIGLRQRILYLGAHYGMAIRARVQRDRSAEELLDRVDVLGRRAPMLAQRFRVRASCRHTTPARYQSFEASLRRSCRRVSIVPVAGAITLNQVLTSLSYVLKNVCSDSSARASIRTLVNLLVEEVPE